MFLSHWEALSTRWRTGLSFSLCLPVLLVYLLTLLLTALYLLDLRVSVHFLLCLLFLLHPQYLVLPCLLIWKIFLPGACLLLRSQTENNWWQKRAGGKDENYSFMFLYLKTPYPLTFYLPYVFGDSIKILKFEILWIVFKNATPGA